MSAQGRNPPSTLASPVTSSPCAPGISRQTPFREPILTANRVHRPDSRVISASLASFKRRHRSIAAATTPIFMGMMVRSVNPAR